MRLRVLIILASTATAIASSPAYAESWTLLVQPAPYSQNPPAYGNWIAYQQYADLQTCLGVRMTLHYDLWDSDRDLSMRALSGVCRSDTSGQIVKEAQSEDEEEL